MLGAFSRMDLEEPSAAASPPPRRPTCPNCLRPARVCVCLQLPSLTTALTRVLLLQHPRESRTGIGTARLAHLSLPGSLLKAGLDFSQDPEVQAAVAAHPAYVLFPGPDAIAIDALPQGEPLTLVVVDGTWWQAKKLITLNPWLVALPRVAFSPRRPSDYRIRRQPAAHCVSTIEALAEVLSCREPQGARFERLLDPFRAMVDLQVGFREAMGVSRHRGRKRPRDKRRPTLPETLRELWPRLVFVQGEANAWPARHPDRPPADLVHWVAQRAASPGERFEAIIAPAHALAPSTARYVELPETSLGTGTPPHQVAAAWTRFVRPDDVLCAFGVYHLGVGMEQGIVQLPRGQALPASGEGLDAGFIDLRNALSQHLKQKLAQVEDTPAQVGVLPGPPAGPGRAHRRLAALRAVAESLVA
ncbi:MAG: DTW domain-containing protein [Myxococcales bacterium]|nr:DTW domain-containing protein [Myxococcales bacterium]